LNFAIFAADTGVLENSGVETVFGIEAFLEPKAILE
jgi:hypothetical protein